MWDYYPFFFFYKQKHTGEREKYSNTKTHHNSTLLKVLFGMLGEQNLDLWEFWILMLKTKRKLHLTFLNYILDYTLYLKLFECIFWTLNYYTYNTLHPIVCFIVKLNGN